MASSINADISTLQNKLDIQKELWKVHAIVIKKYKESGIQNPDQVAEISFLLQCASSNERSFEVASISNNILVQLFKQNYIKQDYLLKMLLTSSATVRDLCCIVTSLREILIFDMSEQLRTSGSYDCPYKIRSPPHPLVTLLQQRQDSFYAILDEIKQSYLVSIESQSKETIYILSVIKPFLSFVLLDPNRSRSWEGHALHSKLVQLLNLLHEAGETEAAYGIADFLLYAYLCRKTDATSIVENVLLIAQLAESLIELRTDATVSNILTKAGCQILCNCHRLLEANLSIKTSLNLLQRLFQKEPRILLKDESIFLLALLLYQSPSVFREDVLKLALLVLPCYLASGSRSRKVNIARSFCLPLLQTLFRGSSENEDHKRCQKLARNIFVNIQREINSYVDIQEEEEAREEPRRELQPSEITIAKHHCILLQRVHRDKMAANEFLTVLEATQRPCDSLLLLLSTLVTSPSDSDLLRKMLHVIATVTKETPSVALDFLPLLLDVTNHCNDPLVTFEILNFLPVLGAHKQLVAPVLKTITLLGLSTPLLPTCIRIATALWRKQPRVFPHLLKLLSNNTEKDNASSKLRQELFLAKAACLLDICKLRPAQHGAEVVGLLANVFDEFEQRKGELEIHSDIYEAAVLLGLEALKALCETEVVEVTTAWSVISPKLQHSTSPTVLRGIISLFSICPNVLGRSSSELAFRREACYFLWSHVNNKNSHVAAAALAALANFSSDEFRVGQLPESVRSWTTEMLLKKHNLKKRPKNDDYDPDNEAIPGLAFIILLQNIENDAAFGYSVLLSKLLKEEVASLPRNLSTANTPKRLGAAYDRFLDSIPEFLRSMHEKSKRPALIPGLSYGLLCCYKSSVLSGKNEKIGRRHFIEDAKVHRQMLDNCLNEIAIPQMDWHHCLAAPTAWTNMMNKVFDVVLEGRKAELSLLYDQGRLESEDKLKTEIENAPLWTRDQLTNQLMKASKGLPSVQGNSILALAGLAYKISLTAANQSARSGDAAPNSQAQFVGNNEWLVRVADTIMVIFNGNFKPRSEPMQWCQQMSSHKSTASSLLARASASISLSVIAVTLISLDLERIEQIANSLMPRISGQEHAGNSAVMQFNCAVGLGLMVSRLEQERFSDIMGAGGHSLIIKAKDILEKTSYNQQLQNRDGAVIALGLALAANFKSNMKVSKADTIAAHSRLLKTMDEMKTDGNPSGSFENACLSLAISTVSAFATDCLHARELNEIIDLLGQVSKAHAKSSTLTSSYGIILHGALANGLARAGDVMGSAIDEWLTSLTSEASSPEEKVAAVSGLMSAFGSHRFLFQFESMDTFDPCLKNKLSVVIKNIQQTMQSSDDTTLCLQCSKSLGLLYMVNGEFVSRQVNLPSNYAYLSDFSLLKAAFGYLIEAGKSGPREEYSSAKVSCVVHGLIAATASTLPPVNWALVLSPLMKIGFDQETRRLCLNFAIMNSSSSRTLPAWLLSWLNPHIFVSLEDACKEEILTNLDTIVKIVPVNRLKMVLEEMTASAFESEKDNIKLQRNVLCGLKKIAAMENPVQSSLLYVRNSLEKISLHCNIIEDEDILKRIADCLISLPKELRESFDTGLQGNVELSLALNSASVAHYGASLKTFQKFLEHSLTDPENSHSTSLQRLKFALQKRSITVSSSKGHEEEIMWFLDQIGQTKKLAGNKNLEALRCWIELLASSIASWSVAGTFPAISNQSESRIYNAATWDTFAANLKTLVQLPRWQHLQTKVIEWLTALLEIVSAIGSEDRINCLLQNSLIALRNCEVWKTQGIWTKSLDLIN